jgi:hypothetical protein
MGNVALEVPSYPLLWGIAGPPYLQGYKNGKLVLQVGGWARADNPFPQNVTCLDTEEKPWNGKSK